ncbi:MAG: 3'-5' exonuclease domain-containing protein 2 [Bacteroidaceae bacterium]|nr:3'-5' exonuclease domain-containing protein 2 [Bacteroidaceae bacterium]
MKTLWNKYEKAWLAGLPRALFEGRIVVVLTEAEAERAVDFLLSQPILGFDTETRPTFRPGPMNDVALLQVATDDAAFLFRLNRIGVCDPVVRLLSDTTVTKVALSWTDDTHQLMRRRRFKMGNIVDLQDYVKKFGIEDASLQKLYANVFGQRISKTQQLSNWEADALTTAQQRYAATDAWACIRLYEELRELQRTGKWELKRHEETVSE